MKIIQALVQQIGGELHIARANENRGACFTVTFNARGLELPPALSDLPDGCGRPEEAECQFG
jgi:hypothetical protein